MAKMCFPKLTPRILSVILDLLFSCYFTARAQQDSVLNRMEQYGLSVIENGEAEEADYGEEYMDFFQLDGQKLNMNTLTENEATALGLTPYQYYQLLLYIEKYGELVSIYEIPAVEGFGNGDLDKLRPYVDVLPVSKEKIRFRTWLFPVRQELLVRYGRIREPQHGYDLSRPTHYLGSPDRVNFRYRMYNNHRFSLGIAAEKDAGEELFRGSQKKGFDHYSGHVHIKNIGILRSLVIGDYRLGFGQGLVIGNGLWGSKGGGVAGVRKFPSDIRAVCSMNEGNYFRGISADIGNARYNAILFYGRVFYDGSVFITERGREFDGSLVTGGYHRTESELEKKRALTNHSYGTNFEIRRKLFRMGLHFVGHQFSAEVLPRNELYTLFDFKGKRLYNAGIDYNVLIGKSILFGEIAYGNKQGIAFLNGIILPLDSRVKLAMLLRHYSRHYIALYSGAFGESSKNQAESGFYSAMDIHAGKKAEITIYSDIYRFLWLRYRIDKPVSGWDISAVLKWKIHAKLQVKWQYLFRKKESGENGTYYSVIANTGKHKMRVEMEYHPFRYVKLKTEVNSLHTVHDLNSSRKTGLLIYQDIHFTGKKLPVELKWRIAYFDTDSYEERIYAYEHDLYYTFTIQGYYYRGWRGYFLLKYRYRFIDFWFRLSQTFYLDRNKIGSGLSEINGPKRTEIKLQTIFRL